MSRTVKKMLCRRHSNPALLRRCDNGRPRQSHWFFLRMFRCSPPAGGRQKGGVVARCQRAVRFKQHTGCVHYRGLCVYLNGRLTRFAGNETVRASTHRPVFEFRRSFASEVEAVDVRCRPVRIRSQRQEWKPDWAKTRGAISGTTG